MNKFTGLIAASISAIAAVTATILTAAPAAALQIESGNLRYDIQTFEGTFDEFEASGLNPFDEPWWTGGTVEQTFVPTSVDLARQFQSTYFEAGGSPRVFFAYDSYLGRQGFFFRPFFASIAGGSMQQRVNRPQTISGTFAYVDSVTKIPTPALLPGLIGLGVAALRKIEKAETEA